MGEDRKTFKIKDGNLGEVKIERLRRQNLLLRTVHVKHC